MNHETSSPDPAAVFACAVSLWRACERRAAGDATLILREAYNGMDELMRVMMRIGNRFEEWACRHLAFAELDNVWPYLLQDKFGEACLAVMVPTGFAVFDDYDCLRVALQLQLPVVHDDKLPLPVDESAINPLPAAVFRALRILTIRDHAETVALPFTLDDEPFDEDYGPLYFGLYGVSAEGSLEHIADRPSYVAAVTLARSLIPGIAFPETPSPAFRKRE